MSILGRAWIKNEGYAATFFFTRKIHLLKSDPFSVKKAKISKVASPLKSGIFSKVNKISWEGSDLTPKAVL